MLKNKADKYYYKTHLLSNKPYQQVNVTFKNKIKQLFCKHTFYYLVREEKNILFYSLKGDTIEIICPKCGKSKGTMLWEYEGMGYK